VRGSHDREPAYSAPLDKLRGLQAVLVHRDRFDLRARRSHHGSRSAIVRLFHQHDVAGIDEHARGEVQRLLRAVDHEDLFWRACDRARPARIVGDRFAQSGQTLRRSVVEVAQRDPARAPRHHPAPCLVRKIGERRRTVPEIIRQHLAPRLPGELHPLRRLAHPAGVRRQMHRRGSPRLRRPSARGNRREMRRQFARDEGARALARSQVALVEQLPVSH